MSGRASARDPGSGRSETAVRHTFFAPTSKSSIDKLQASSSGELSWCSRRSSSGCGWIRVHCGCSGCVLTAPLFVPAAPARSYSQLCTPRSLHQLSDHDGCRALTYHIEVPGSRCKLTEGTRYGYQAQDLYPQGFFVTSCQCCGIPSGSCLLPSAQRQCHTRTSITPSSLSTCCIGILFSMHQAKWKDDSVGEAWGWHAQGMPAPRRVQRKNKQR